MCNVSFHYESERIHLKIGEMGTNILLYNSDYVYCKQRNISTLCLPTFFCLNSWTCGTLSLLPSSHDQASLSEVLFCALMVTSSNSRCPPEHEIKLYLLGVQHFLQQQFKPGSITGSSIVSLTGALEKVG